MGVYPVPTYAGKHRRIKEQLTATSSKSSQFQTLLKYSIFRFFISISSWIMNVMIKTQKAISQEAKK